MTAITLDRQAILTALVSKLEAETNDAGAVRFVQVFSGEPLGLPIGGPYAAVWYLGRTDAREGRMTLGNIMYAARFQIMAWWPRTPEVSALQDLEADIWGADESIRTRIRADSTINSEVTDLDILESSVSYGGFPAGAQVLYRSLEMELRLDNLEGEPISA